MPQISRSALVPFSVEQMYTLVNDVDAYPQFLPGCTGSRILENSDTSMTAAVDVSKAGISKTFTTKNTLISNKRIDGYLAALKKHNIKVDRELIIYCDFNQDYAFFATEELLMMKKRSSVLPRY